MEDAAAACMRVLRRLPPTQVEKGLAGLGRLIEDQQLIDQCHQKADKPLTLAQCQETNSPFLQCEFNREGDSFRSPWSNRYQPPLPEAPRLPDHLRQLEVQANERFEEYRRLYFEGGVGSVYLWPTTGQDFAGCFLIKRGTNHTDINNEGVMKTGTWESTHLISVSFDSSSKQIAYKLTSTLFLMLELGSDPIGALALNGSLNRAMVKTQTYVKEPFGEHLVYGMIGLIEDMEKELRSDIEMIYIGKSQEIMTKARHVDVQSSQRYRIY